MMEENRLILYMHAGSGNHGCEAIVNSLCHMIQETCTLVSYRKAEDERYSLKEFCELVQERSFESHRAAHLLYYIYRRFTGDGESFIRYRYRQVLKGKRSPLAISIGGDNYCYDNMLSDLRLTNAAFRQKGTRTVLLGCSIEPEILENRQVLEDLGKYHTIIARESVTYKALQRAFHGQGEEVAAGKQVSPESVKSLPRILCYPDPAFFLKPKETALPEHFTEGQTVGINVSPLIQGKEAKPGITMDNYRRFIQYILEDTKMQVALIPHVVWAGNDDREPLHDLYQEFVQKEQGKYAERLCEVTDRDCMELKSIIGRCRFFVGARTHATIAAYSSCVPTLVVGYSVKARGIARDLFGTEENYVLPVQSLKEPEDLMKGFRWLLEREEAVRTRLQSLMPEYVKKALETGREVDRLWEEFGQRQKI